MSHSIIPPSSAGIWGKPGGCTGWVEMAQRYPEDGSGPDALNGEASHEIGGGLIGEASRGRKRDKSAYIGDRTANGVIFTEEMFDGAELYADDVAAVMHSLKNFNPHIEQRTHAKRIHELSEGTPDCWLYDPRTHTLYIWDYKYGYLVVEAFENWQAINYLAGILDELGLTSEREQSLNVKVRIVQPRAHHKDGPVREWAFICIQAVTHIEQLKTAAAEALSGNGVLRTGPHCRYCQARHACGPALAAGMGLFECASAPLPVELSIEATGVQLSIIKRAIKQLEGLETAFEEQVKGFVRAGKLVPGWGMENTFGAPDWSRPVSEIIALGEMLGKDLRKAGTKTPLQAKKLGIDEAVIMAYSSPKKTGLKLVPQAGDYARKVFSQ